MGHLWQRWPLKSFAMPRTSSSLIPSKAADRKTSCVPRGIGQHCGWTPHLAIQMRGPLPTPTFQHWRKTRVRICGSYMTPGMLAAAGAWVRFYWIMLLVGKTRVLSQADVQTCINNVHAHCHTQAQWHHSIRVITFFNIFYQTQYIHTHAFSNSSPSKKLPQV